MRNRSDHFNQKVLAMVTGFGLSMLAAFSAEQAVEKLNVAVLTQ